MTRGVPLAAASLLILSIVAHLSARPEPPPGSMKMPADPSQASAGTDGQALETGAATAAATIVQFADFTSEPSSRLAFMLKALVDLYPKDVRVIFKNDPDMSRPDAVLAHEAALAAAAQGKFWEMSDIIFSNQHKQQREDLIGMASQLGLDLKRFKADLDGGGFLQAIESDRQEAMTLKIAKAPACLFDGQALAWPLTFRELKTMVDKKIAATRQ
jgi:protein-disulfide isomerase